MLWVAIDPSSTWIGVAAYDGKLRLCKAIRVREDWAAAQEVAALVRAVAPGPFRLAVERASDTAPVEAHGRQGKIGWMLGWAGGLVAGAIAPQEEPVTLYTTDWRPTLCRLVSEAPAPFLGLRCAIGRIEHGPDREHREVAFRCGQKLVVRVEVLAPGKVGPNCPRCAKTTRAKDDTRDRWKERAVRGALATWPELVTPVIAEARTRARPTTPDHKLEGVADACEAAWIARHAAELL
jgi:hypothetical protein